MGITSDGPAKLSFVTRLVTGDIVSEKTTFDTKLRENVKTKTKVKDPVIVFFPNRTSQVMCSSEAERRGYLETPEIMNFESVTDQKSVAGQFKFAMHTKQRMDAWQQMEDRIVGDCISKSGHPFDQDVNYSKSSILAESFKEPA
jgi:hypothetical protein